MQGLWSSVMEATNRNSLEIRLLVLCNMIDADEYRNRVWPALLRLQLLPVSRINTYFAYSHFVEQDNLGGISSGFALSFDFVIHIMLLISDDITLRRWHLDSCYCLVLSKSSLLGWFLHVSLILIIKGRYPREVSLIVIIMQVSAWLSLIIKLFHHFSPNLSKSAHDSPDQTDDRIKI